MSSQLRVEIGSPPDREMLVACLMLGNVQWGEINQENPRLEIEIYPDRSGNPWVFSLDELIELLQLARQRLESQNS
jgi:hypothetical protein